MRLLLAIVVITCLVAWASDFWHSPPRGLPPASMPATPRAELAARMNQLKRDGVLAPDAQLMGEEERRRWIAQGDPATQPTATPVASRTSDHR